MKKYLILSLAALAMLSSCKKDNNGDANSFTATIEQSGAKTEIVAGSDANLNKVTWVANDQISINGVTYQASEVNSTNATRATFTKQGDGADPTSPYQAIYPASLHNGTAFALPAMQTCSGDNSSNMPMYAYSTSHNLTFKNLCGVLEITVSNGMMSKVKQITVTADKRLNGTFEVQNGTTDNPTISFTGSSTPTAADKMVTLVMENAVTVGNDGAKFYIAIPANTYSSLQIDVIGKNTSDNTAVKRLTATSGSIVVSRNDIYPITFSSTNANVTDATTGTAMVESTSGPTSCDWVQLWEGGPLWATVNVGATISDYDHLDATAETNNRSSSTTTNYTTANVGGLYCWGGKTFNNFRVGSDSPTSGSDADYYNSSDLTDIASTDRDIAKGLWGSNWRMPTQAEMNGLKNVSNCTWSSSFDTKGSGITAIQGCTVTGADGDYRSNSIFLPAAGYLNGSSLSNVDFTGYFWTSKANGISYAYRLYFNSLTKNVDSSNSRSHGYSVRAVLVTD